MHICSNGFSFKFVKRLGTIIPIWEDIPDAPKYGSRITVEGLTDEYTEQLIEKMQTVFGVDYIENFYSTCPVLYLRQLSKVSVDDGDNLFSIEIEPVNKEFSSDLYDTSDNPVAGIMHHGRLHTTVWENLRIYVTNGQEMNVFDSVRFSMMFSFDGTCRVGSVFAPVMDDESGVSFKKGALYRTLPMDGHVLQVPLAVNAPFKTDSGRSKLEDSRKNQYIAGFVFGRLLCAFFVQLRSIPGINIERYVPKDFKALFENYKNVGPVNLKKRIHNIPILHAYSGGGFVSCTDALVLPLECYDWADPEKLRECFCRSSGTLVERYYVNKGLACQKIELCNAKFADNINCYLNAIGTRNWIPLLQQEIYPYLNQHYEDILMEYRKIGRQNDLKSMCIYAFKMADGSIARECAASNTIWMSNVPAEYMSFGEYRNIEESSIRGGAEKYKWIKDLHEIIDFKTAFTGNKLNEKKIGSWEKVTELIETILYYGVREPIRIPYLADCALTSEFDEQDNLFRTAYLETNNTEILKHVITRDDLLDISQATGVYDAVSLTELAGLIKSMGLRSADDFFEDRGKGTYELNTNTLSLLEAYCDSDEKATTVINTICQAFSIIRKNHNAQLVVLYEDIVNCSNAVFAKIFEYGLLSGDTQSNLAEMFCDSHEVQQDSVDYNEACLRALCVIGKVPETKSICIQMDLSDIIERGLGQCAQSCKLANPDTDIFSLILNIDLEVEAYPSCEIEQALRWLDNEQAVSASYEYYTANLAEAFGSGDNQLVCFLFDDEKVILNAGSPKNSMLKFVQKRYKGKDASFSALINIISEQNELKEPWTRSKKEYVEKLSKFRKDTWKQKEILFPGYDEHLNQATGNAADCVLPELLQNINDCKAGPGQNTRTLKVEIDAKKGTMLLQYDEAGFDFANVYSITAIGQSTKHDESEGEKGLGFKKVFTIFNRVEIYSNGFSFSLTSEHNTVPKWIDDKERQVQYLLDGKTTMLFTAADSKKEQMTKMLETLEAVIKGKYVGNPISPLFLKNIDFIYLNGMNRYYSRKEMEQEFIFTKVQMLPFYEKLLEAQMDETDVQKKIDEIKKQLQTRKKCQLMNAAEIDQFINSLTVEIAIPKKVNSAKAKGCFYSTLPTESYIHAYLYINLPLELTTGRNEIVEDSTYNKAVFHLLFAPYADGQAMFKRIFEKIAFCNRDIHFLDYIIPELENFIRKICAITGNTRNEINKVLEHAEILYSCELDGMVSLLNSYSVDRIICLYLNEIKKPKNDIQTWMKSKSEDSRKWKLILPSTKVECENLERFARTVETPEGYFPIQDEGCDFTVEYLKDEYGYIGGDEFDEQSL